MGQETDINIIEMTMELKHGCIGDVKECTAYTWESTE